MKIPELDGDETIKKIKADKRFADIPVIMLSSENDTADVLEGFRLGAADCVPEPLSGPLLLKCIASHLLIIQKNKVTAICGKAAPPGGGG
jgi:DNA-binding response OmpR family regulator